MRRLVLPLVLALVPVFACGGTRERPDSRHLCPQCDSPAEICEQCPYPEDRGNFAAWADAQNCFSVRQTSEWISCWEDCLGTESSTAAAVRAWVLDEEHYRNQLKPWEIQPGRCELPDFGL